MTSLFRKFTTTSFITALALGVIAACSSTSSSQVSKEVAPTTATSAPAEEVTTTTMEPEAGAGRISFVYGPTVGDCVDHRSVASGKPVTVNKLPIPDGSIKAEKDVIFRLSCDLPHQYEIIEVTEAGLPSQPPPTTEQFLAMAKKKCPAAFTTYIGKSFSSSSLEVGWILPTEEQRNRGIQFIGCTAFDPKGKMVGSVRDSQR